MNVLLRHDALAGFDSLIDQLFAPAAAQAAAGTAPRRIRVDVKETPEAYVVHAELAGVKKEAIHVEVEANEVVIAAGAPPAREAKEGERWLHVERPALAFERRFALPLEIDGARAEARHADGVLELRLPRKAPAGARKVEVH
jgi:HSP20 family protein